jgi:hypothetical protein
MFDMNHFNLGIPSKTGRSPQLWTYQTIDDTATLDAQGYFDNGTVNRTQMRTMMKVGDLIYAHTSQGDPGAEFVLRVVSEVTTAGVISISDAVDAGSGGGGGFTEEQVQDIVATMFTTVTNNNVAVTYDDTGGTVSIDITDPGGDTIIINNQNRDFKESVKVATTATITLSGEQTIDGVLTSASRILVKNHSTGSLNGIYVTASGSWTRADDFDADAEVTSGLLVTVEDGTTQADTVWTLTTADPITLGTTALVFARVALPTTFPTTTTNNNTSITINNNSLSNRWVQLSSSSAVTVTINNTNSIPVNTEIYFQKTGTGLVTFAASGVTIVAPFGLNLVQRYSYAMAKKTGTTTWTLIAYDEVTRIPQRISNADTTLTLADAGCHIYRAVGETVARTWTIPANSSVAFPIGTVLSFINDGTSGDVTIAITTDTLVLSGTGSTGSRTLAVYGQATATKVTATRWYIIGTGLT